MTHKFIKGWLPIVLVLMTFNSCNYSFTGASIAPDIHTISIQYFPNYATLGPPSLSQSFTEALKDLFIRQTSLTLVTRNGDLQFEGQISGYSVSPIAIQANDNAAENRLIISVDVKFTNVKDPSQNFEETFSRYVNFPSNQNLASVEEDLIKNINDQLVQDIFNRSVSNW